MAQKKKTIAKKTPAKKSAKKAPAKKTTATNKAKDIAEVGDITRARKFMVSEPIDITIIQEINGRYVDEISTRKTFKNHFRFTENYGCYVFAIKTDTELKPVYVGQAFKQPLGHESFTSNKRWKLDKALTKTIGGTLLVQFIVPVDDEPLTQRMLNEMESALIQFAYRKNPRIENKKRVKKPIKNQLTEWSIDWDSDNGKLLKEMLGI